MLGHTIHGNGPKKVIVMHGLFADCSVYDYALPFLDLETFTYIFADLRGYGKSIGLQGEYNVVEAKNDIIELANHLNLDKFYIVGHAMSTLVAQRIAMKITDRIKAVAIFSPVPANGLSPPEEDVKEAKEAALGNDEKALQIIASLTDESIPETFIKFKLKKWRETSVAEARIGYIDMIVTTDFVADIEGLRSPMLVAIGRRDEKLHSEEMVNDTFLKWYPKTELAFIQNAGHYPMQETPIYFVGLLEGFLKKHP